MKPAALVSVAVGLLAGMTLTACATQSTQASTLPTPVAAVAATPNPTIDALATAEAATAVAAPAPTSDADPGASAGADAEIARPSNAGGPGAAIHLVGDLQAGQQIFVQYCQVCHGQAGQGGVNNPGSTDGTVPPLNPIDETLVSASRQTFADNLDLFLQNGSTPEGDKPALLMPAWGKTKALTQQQIADVIAFVMSLNPTKK